MKILIKTVAYYHTKHGYGISASSRLARLAVVATGGIRLRERGPAHSSEHEPTTETARHRTTTPAVTTTDQLAMLDSMFHIHQGDIDILEYLDREGSAYVAIIAARTGKHPPYVDRRCHRLSEYGLLEDVDDGVIYRISETGREQLEKHTGSPRSVRG